MPFLERDQAKLYFEFHGKNTEQVVTLLNGYTRSSADFRMFARVLEGNGFSVVLLDNRGSGRTETPAFHAKDYWEDVVALWDHLSIQKSHVLGISMGGMISQCLGIYHPERVNKLILISTASHRDYIKPTGGAWTTNEQDISEKMKSYFAPDFVERNQVLFQSMIKQIKLSVQTGRFSERADLQSKALSEVQDTIDLSKIKSKTLIIHGKEDLVIPIEGGQTLHQGIKNSKISIIEGAGHLLLAEIPKLVYQEVVSFLKEESL